MLVVHIHLYIHIEKALVAMISSSFPEEVSLSPSPFEGLLNGAPRAKVIQLRVFNHQNDETLSRTPLMYMSKENLPIAVH